jgi:hypothetical protein
MCRLILKVLLVVMMVASIPTVFASEQDLAGIVTAVQASESRIQDMSIEYTCIRKPFGRSDVPNDGYPGWWKQQSGTLTVKGDKVKLERSYFDSVTAKPLKQVLAYGGALTLNSCTTADSNDIGCCAEGRTHNFSSWFNPILALSVTGGKSFSAELLQMDAVLKPETANVNGVTCQVIELYRKTAKGTNLRSFKVYVDPSKDWAIRKVEKYWNNFKCLEKVMEIKEYTTTGGVLIPSKATYIEYERPHGKKTSTPVVEQELQVTNIKLNQQVPDSAFAVVFSPGTKVWNDILRMSYVIPDGSQMLPE